MSVSLSFHRRHSVFSLPKEMKLPMLFSLLMAATNGFLSIVVFSTLQPIIPLLYTLPQLDQQLVHKQFIFIIPSIAVGIFFLNLFFGKLLSKFDYLMMQLASWLTVFFEFLLLFALIRIIVII